MSRRSSVAPDPGSIDSEYTPNFKEVIKRRKSVDITLGTVQEVTKRTSITPAVSTESEPNSRKHSQFENASNTLERGSTNTLRKLSQVSTRDTPANIDGLRPNYLDSKINNVIPGNPAEVITEGTTAPQRHEASHLSKNGISIKLIRKLAEIVQIRDATMSTSKVKNEIIKPFCSYLSTSLSDLFENHYSKKIHPDLQLTAEHAIYQSANIFVSYHSYCNFLELVNAIESFHDKYTHENPKTNPSYWFDFSGKNLSVDYDYPDSWWATVYLQFIHNIGHTCVVVTPVDNPRILSNVWCLYEIICTKYTDTKMTIQTTNKEYENLIRNLYTKPNDIVARYTRVDVKTTDLLRNNRDRESILDAMQCILGSSETATINAYLNNIFRHWVKSLVEEELSRLEIMGDRMYNNPQTIRLLSFLASQVEILGDLSGTEMLCRKIIGIEERIHGRDHPETAQAIINLAIVCKAKNDFPEAEKHYRRALHIREKTLGPNHLLTSESTSQLADVLNLQGKSFEAQEQYRLALQRYEQSVGVMNHAEALTTIHDLAVSLSSNGDLAEATVLHKKALEGRISIFTKAVSESSAPEPLSESLKASGGAASQSRRQSLQEVLQQKGSVPVVPNDHLPTLTEAQRRISIDTSATDGSSSAASRRSSMDSDAPPFVPRKSVVDALGAMNASVTLSVTHHDLIASQQALALLLIEDHKYEEAERLFRQVFRSCLQAYGMEAVETVDAMKNLASVLSQLRLYEEAYLLHHKVFEVCERVYGLDDGNTLSAVDDLSATAMMLGKSDEVEAIYKRILSFKNVELGVGDSSTLSTMEDLAHILDSHGKKDEAISYLEKSLSLHEKKYGEGHPNTLTIVFKLSSILESQKRFDEAEVLCLRQLRYEEKTLGERDTHTLFTMHRHGDLLRLQGKLEEAQEEYNKALTGRLVVFGPEHIDTVTSFKCILELLKSQNKNEEILKFFQSYTNNIAEVFGPCHINTINGLLQLAKYQKLKRDMDGAKATLRLICERREQDPGPLHVETADAWIALADLSMDLDRPDEAEPLYNKALAIKDTILGPGHTQTILVARSLALTYDLLDKYESSEPLHRRVLEYRQKTYGLENSHAVSALYSLIECLRSQKKLRELEELHVELLEKSKKTLGLDNPFTKDCANRLIQILNELNKKEEAQLVRRDVL